jgi:hypothetical protein
MSLAQLVRFPRHLLAATIQRGRDRFPVTVTDITAYAVTISSSPLARGERARLTIACPLVSESLDVAVTAESPDVLAVA